MRRLRFNRSAQRDLIAIARYIAEQGSPEIAKVILLRLRGHCERLAALPGTLGTARDELEPGLRSTPHKGYILYFRYTDDALEIVDILDARRDTLAHFGEHDPEV